MSERPGRLCLRRTAPALGLLIGLVAGCSARARVELYQPGAPPAQEHIVLTSATAHAANNGDRRACVLAFPLPRAWAGTPFFHVYVELPVAPGDAAVAAAGSWDTARGFLIQHDGERAGLTRFVAGSVRTRNVLLNPHRHRLLLDVRCADGTQIRGEAIVEDAPSEVRAFQRRFAADVAALADESPPGAAVSAERRSPRPQP